MLACNYITAFDSLPVHEARAFCCVSLFCRLFFKVNIKYQSHSKVAVLTI